MAHLVVIGTSPHMDTSIGAGPFRSEQAARDASDEMIYRGWTPEVVELIPVSEIPSAHGDAS
jgi:hypothetical protein